ncbi:unnamed protein product [Meloidogyne enterolobii]|uniref:Uncharacterized protein n=1 Tax=Meloidogyne enterolobii TaxID=390850 RepID=A0ACB0Y649_MELEN
MREYDNKIKNNLDILEKKNKCTGKKNKVIYPSEDTQKKLIENYLGKNEKFRDAIKMTKNLNIKRLFDRIEDEEYKVNVNKMIVCPSSVVNFKKEKLNRERHIM